jgi:RND family efflux transporter MFP subunit
MTDTTPSVKKPVRLWRVVGVGTLVAIAFGGSAAYGLRERTKTKNDQAEWTAERAIPTVELVSPVAGPAETTLRLTGNIDAYYMGTIHARANGYVTKWFYDIGARVKKGDTLAVVDSPDLDQQLAQAHADLVRARADETLAQATAQRWQTMAQRDVVSLQARDEKVGDAQAKSAAVLASQANVSRLEALASYKNIDAPFAGIVTARSLDVGDLVSATGNTSGKALFTISDISKVRVYVRVPQAYLGEIKPGLHATLVLPQFPERIFDAVMTSSSNALSENSRTALVQLQADNPDGALWPGSYAEVTFHIPTDPGVMRVPATALIFSRKGMRVASVDQDKVKMLPVRLGRNLGADVEIISGLPKGIPVINRPPETLRNGDDVKIADPMPQNSSPNKISQK